MPVFAFGLDTSIDDEIRKNYTPSKIEDDMQLPALPKILHETTPQIKTISQSKFNSQKQINLQPSNYKYTATRSTSECYATLKQGTKINVELQNSISDKSKKGTKITFISKYPVSTTYFTIPMGTVFNGEIINSHRPQFAGNGGLIEIKINSIILNGEIRPINAVVTEANFKNVFFNTIKGKRNYTSSMLKSIKPGCHFFKKMISVSGNLAQDGSTMVLIPFSFGLGTLALGGNILISPALALFSKGSSIYIREGSNFEIELAQDVFIYN